MNKRLYLSKNDKKLAGVCGGIAEYLEVDPTIVRLFWIFFTFAWGTGLIIYIAAAIIMTERPSGSYVVKISTDEVEGEKEESFRTIDVDQHPSQSKEVKVNKNNNNLLIGFGMVIIGSYLFTRNFFNLYWLNFRFILPGLVIAAGVYVLVNGRK